MSHMLNESSSSGLNGDVLVEGRGIIGLDFGIDWVGQMAKHCWIVSVFVY